MTYKKPDKIIRVNEDVFREFKILCAEHGTKMANDMVEILIERYKEQRSNKTK